MRNIIVYNNNIVSHSAILYNRHGSGVKICEGPSSFKAYINTIISHQYFFRTFSIVKVSHNIFCLYYVKSI